MSEAARSQSRPLVSRKPPRHLIIARGENVRTIVLRPWLTGCLAAFFAIFGVAYLAATGYLFFRDDLLAASIARQNRMQRAYEDRIAALRSDIDRLVSRQLVSQQAYEAKIAGLIDRQSALDTRQDILSGLGKAAEEAGLVPARKGAKAPAADTEANADVPGKPRISGALGRAAGPSLAGFLRPSRPDVAPEVAAPAAAGIGSLENSLDNLAAEQVAFVEDIGRKARQKTGKIRAILARLGHKTKGGTGSDIGGPFVPLTANVDPDTFRSGVELVSAEIEELGAARRLASRLPLGGPIANAPITSRFGARLDPFLGKPAMHTGIDFKTAAGKPVRATAAGTVVLAEYSGGYGNMVEIDHGNGLTTRYAHMSRFAVKPGDVVAKGGIVGRAGSTGRSTGPHVHYEVRADGKALDPMRYLRAGGELAPLL